MSALTFAEQVAADPRSYWYTDTKGRPRWGDKRSARKADVAASGFARQLMSPQQAEAAGMDWPCLMAGASVLPELPRAEPEKAPPEAEPVPDYDAAAEAVELEAGDGADDAEELPEELAAMADPKMLMELVEYSSDLALDLLVMAAYIRSPVQPQKLPTPRERVLWRNALSAYVRSELGDVQMSPAAVLLGTAAVIVGPRVVHGQAHQMVKLVAHVKQRQAAAA